VPTDDLLSPTSYPSPKKRQTGLLIRPISNHPHTYKVDADSDMASSMRIGVLSCSVHTRPSSRDNNAPGSSADSVRSIARSTTSVSSAASTSTVSASRNPNPTGMSPARRIANDMQAGRLAMAHSAWSVCLFLYLCLRFRRGWGWVWVCLQLLRKHHRSDDEDNAGC